MTALRAVEWIVVCVFALTALLVLAGLTRLWFVDPTASMPYLNKLVVTLIVEAIASAFVLFRHGMRYRPTTKNCEDTSAFEKFFADFVMNASTVQILTNRLSWVSNSSRMQSLLCDLAKKNRNVQIVTNQKVDIAPKLIDAGVRIWTMPDGSPAPEARFTLINGDRAGAERLAIAVGTFPEHTVYMFDNNSGPHIVALAKDAFAHASRSASRDV